MNKVLKSLILASCVTGLSLGLGACSSTGNIDYSDDVETPDVLLEDASGGDSEYGLDKNAARNNQQNKPDGLESSTNSRSSVDASSSQTKSRSDSQRETRADSQVKQERQPKVETQVTQSKPVKQTKPKKPKKQPSQQESALEVEDPLLGEIDPQ